MIEFTDDLSYRMSGKNALEKRVKTRLSHTTKDIPYYTRGVDVFEFTYGSQAAAIRMALRDLGCDVRFDSNNSRVQIYDVLIDVSKEIN